MKFIVRDGKVYGRLKKDEEEIYLCPDIRIIELKSKLETNDIEATLEFYFAGEERRVSVPRSTYQTKRNILVLQDKGLSVTEENAKYMVWYLQDQEEKLKLKKVHHKLGYDQETNSFKMYDSIPEMSVYDGELDLKPKGSLQKWLEMYNGYVKGSKELEFLFVVGLSSALIGMIGKKISMENPIICVYSDSTCGKTTAVQLALSSWGNPGLRENGLMQTFNETTNSIMHNLNHNNGLPMCFDEISMSATENYTSFIYAVSNGKEKGRLSNEVGKGFVKLDQATWNTVVFCTGEYNILEYANENDGLKVRVFSVGGIRWTKDAEETDKIKDMVTSNYGYLGPIFAKQIMEIGQDALISRYNKCYEKMCNYLSRKKIQDDFTNRRAKFYAVLLLTYEIANATLKLELTLEGIATMIATMEQESIKERNVSQLAYDKVLEEIAKNRKKFPIMLSKRKGGTTIHDDVWGYVLRDDKQVEIFPSEFKRLCRNMGFQSHTVILNKWKQKNLLDHEGDRNVRSRNGTNMYVINVSQQFVNEISGNEDEPIHVSV